MSPEFSPKNEIDVKTLLKMALPITLGFVGIMLMNTVDLLVVGRLGALEMASVGLGSIFWNLLFMPGLGIGIGLEFPVSFNFGARRHSECRRVLIQGFWIVTVYSVLSLVLPWFVRDLLHGVIADKTQADLSLEYFHVSLWGVWPALVFTIFRVYLQGLGRVAPAFWVLASANVVNLFFAVALVFGYWGFPRWEVYGSAVATNISRYYMMIALGLYILVVDKRMWILAKNLKLKPSWPRIKEILKLSIPSGLQVAFEGGVFSLSTIIAATFDVVSSAAHQAVLNLAANSFMIPLGISSAAAVLVGQSYGRRNGQDLKRAGQLGYQIALAWMLGTSAVLLMVPEFFLGWYTHDAAVIETGKGLMLVAAAFQIADGIQVMGTGTLRGIGDTQSSMYVNLVGHWAFGLPVGLLLAYTYQMKIQGIWIGLATGLWLVALVLVGIWVRKSRRIISNLR